MIVWLGHSQDGVDYAIFTQKPKWILCPQTKRWHWQGSGCSVPGLNAHAVERTMGIDLGEGELVKLKVEVEE